MLARFLAELLESFELFLNLLVELEGVDDLLLFLEARSFDQHLVAGLLDLLEILVDQSRDEPAHDLAVFDHLVEHDDGLAVASRIHVLTSLGALRQVGFTQSQAHVAELFGTADHLDELGRIDTELLLVEQTTFGVEEEQSRLLRIQLEGLEEFLFLILQGLDHLLVTCPGFELLDRVTITEEGALKVGAATILVHGAGVKEDHHRLLRTGFAVHGVMEALTFFPVEKGALTGDVRCSTAVSGSTGTGSTGCGGGVGAAGNSRGRTDASSLCVEGGTRNREQDHQAGDQCPPEFEIHYCSKCFLRILGSLYESTIIREVV